ncbi:MAG: pyridoxamine 5'-phosphate oxidase family protein [Caldilineaceae bacterium]
MPAMTQEQIDAFLHSDVLCRLGCLDDEGYPYVVPCWFTYADGGFCWCRGPGQPGQATLRMMPGSHFASTPKVGNGCW